MMNLPVNLEERPLSYSSLKHFRKSPKHYVQYIVEPRKPPTDSQIIGTAFELALFEPEKYGERIMVYEKPNLRSNAGKEEWQKIKDQGKGKVMITEEQAKTVQEMTVSARSNDEMMRYVSSVTRLQRRLKWTDKKAGIPFIGYVDAEGQPFGEDFSFEIKTTKSADPNDFIRDYIKYDYHMQTATYSAGYSRIGRFPNFMVLAFENTAPYNCTPFLIEGKTLEAAKEEWRNSVDAFRFCIDNDMFDKGYEFLLQSMDYFALRIPGYYKPRF